MLPVLFQPVVRTLALRRIARADRSDGDAARLLSVLEQTIRHVRSPEEAHWIGRIEALRGELRASGKPVAITDYGAGKPGMHLTEEQMRQGRIVRRTVGAVCRDSSKHPFWAFFLFRLIREFKPAVCVELGTALGISGAYQAAALALNGTGRLITLEGAEALATIARENLARLGLDTVTVVPGRFQDTLAGVLAGQPTIDYAFIDGHHDEQATIGYFAQILPQLSRTSVMIFDDIAWTAGMKRAWRTIVGHERLRTVADLGDIGVCLSADGTVPKHQYTIPLG